MLSSQTQQNTAVPKPIWMIKGTCGGCKGFKVEPNQRELANVKCSMPGSSMRDLNVGMMQVNTCVSYEAKKVVPPGFTLV